MRIRGFLGNKGASSLLLLLIVGSAAAVASFQIYDRVTQQVKINDKSNISFSRELVLKSALEYTKYALKNRWCMTNLWVQDPICASSFVAALKHDRGLERLILTEDEMNSIWLAMQHLPAGSVNPLASVSEIQLRQIEKTVTVNQFRSIDFGDTSNGGLGEHHPLFSIVKGLTKASINSLTFKLERIANNGNPDPPNWTRVRVRVTSDGGSYVEETLLLSAVEIGTYGLLLNGALNLSGEEVSHSSFNVTTTTAKDGPGLHFLSPVFINGNLVLPRPEATDRFANVTFHDKVTLATLPPIDAVSASERAGLPMTLDEEGALTPYTPVSFGAVGQSSYSDIKNFGGLLRGVQLQAAADWGAFFLFDSRASSVDPSTLRSNMNVCIRRNQILSDLSLTNKAVLIVQKQQPEEGETPANQTDFKYKLATSNEANFYAAYRRQSGIMDFDLSRDALLMEKPRNSLDDLSPSFGINDWDYTRPILLVTVDLGTTPNPLDPFGTLRLAHVEARLSRASTLSIPLYSVDKFARQALKDAKAVAETNRDAAINTLNNRYGTLRTKIQNFNNARTASGYTDINAIPLVPNSAPTENGQINIDQSQAQLQQVSNSVTQWDPVATQAELPQPEPAAPLSPNPLTNPFNAAKTALTNAQDALTAYQQAKTTLSQAIQALDKANDANSDGNRPKLVLKINPNRLDMLNVKFSVENSANLSTRITGMTIKFHACEIGTNGRCENLRTLTTVPYSPTGMNVPPSPQTMSFSVQGAEYARTITENPASPYQTDQWTNLNGTIIPETPVVHTAPPATDPALIDEQCNGTSLARLADKFNEDNQGADHLVEAFTFAGFDYDYLGIGGGGAKVSWDFHPNASDITFNSSMEGDFQVYGIVPKCKIDSTMKFLAGFLVCKELEIKERNTPLTIVGSILTGKVTIHPSALRKGITWSSIYNPEGIASLRKKKILRSGVYDSATNVEVPCEKLSRYNGNGDPIGDDSRYPANPIWNPYQDFATYGATIRCSPLTLRGKANPFTWNSVEPLCGLKQISENNYENKTTCKARRPMVFQEIILGRKEKI